MEVYSWENHLYMMDVPWPRLITGGYIEGPIFCSHDRLPQGMRMFCVYQSCDFRAGSLVSTHKTSQDIRVANLRYMFKNSWLLAGFSWLVVYLFGLLISCFEQHWVGWQIHLTPNTTTHVSGYNPHISMYIPVISHPNTWNQQCHFPVPSFSIMPLSV